MIEHISKSVPLLCNSALTSKSRRQVINSAGFQRLVAPAPLSMVVTLKNKMKKKLINIIMISALFIVSHPLVCHANNYSDVEGKIKKGQSKQAIIELLGKPLEKINIVKHNRFIWGPEEEFWDNIPIGTRLEVWKYEMSDGNLNLYFIDEGKHLGYKAFAPKGVVY